MVIIVYDISELESFNSVQKWANDIHEMKGDDGNLILVGNKSDMTTKRVVSFEDGKKKANEIKAACFIETSAKNGYNVKEL